MVKEESESDRERAPNRNTFAYKEKHRDEQKRERGKRLMKEELKDGHENMYVCVCERVLPVQKY